MGGGVKRHSTLCKKYDKMTATVILYIGFSLYNCREKTTQTVWKTWKTQGISFCQICKLELEYFGHHVSGSGISPTKDRVRAVIEARMPKTASEVRSFLGLVNFSARFIPNLAIIA